MTNKKILMYIGGFIAFILITVGLVNIILLIPPFLNIEYDNDWIGFYGSIAGGVIGGMFSFFGVFLTVRYYIKKDNNENEKELEKNRLLVLPYFKITDTEDDGTFTRDRTVNFFPRERQENMMTVNKAFIIENIGLGTAVNLRFTSMLYSENDMNDISFAFKPGDKEKFLLLCDLAHIRGGNTTFLTVEFEDLLNNAYKQTFVLKYNVDGANRIISFRNNLKPKLRLFSIS